MQFIKNPIKKRYMKIKIFIFNICLIFIYFFRKIMIKFISIIFSNINKSENNNQYIVNNNDFNSYVKISQVIRLYKKKIRWTPGQLKYALEYLRDTQISLYFKDKVDTPFLWLFRDYVKRNVSAIRSDLRHWHSVGGFLTMKHIDSRVNVSPRSERAAHLSGSPTLKASSHHERIFVNKIYGRWTVPYRGVLPPPPSRHRLAHARDHRG